MNLDTSVSFSILSPALSILPAVVNTLLQGAHPASCSRNSRDKERCLGSILIKEDK